MYSLLSLYFAILFITKQEKIYNFKGQVYPISNLDWVLKDETFRALLLHTKTNVIFLIPFKN